jgi:hypothetical protein
MVDPAQAQLVFLSLSPRLKKHHPCQKSSVFFYASWRGTTTRERPRQPEFKEFLTARIVKSEAFDFLQT